jgi:hypothetical protein
MKKTIFFILMGLSPLLSLGQLAVLRDNGTGIPITANEYVGVKGSPYLEEFHKGTMYLKTGLKVEGLFIALNAYQNKLEYKLEGALFSYDKDKLSGFSYPSATGEQVEFTSEFEIPTLQKKRFLQVLEKGKYTLLFHPYKILTDDPSATYGAQAAKVFQDEKDLFVAVDGKVFLLRNKEKFLKEAFGTDTEKAVALIKSLKVNFNKIETLRVLIQELNKE